MRSIDDHHSIAFDSIPVHQGGFFDTAPPLKSLIGFVLWSLVGLFAVLDVTSTQYGLALGLVEVNPLGQIGLAALGIWSLVGGKIFAIALGVIFWRILENYQIVVPATYCLCWGTAVLINANLLITIP